MKVKTAELSGRRLHWAVALCEGWQYMGEDDHTRPAHKPSKDYPGRFIDDYDAKGPHPRLVRPDGEAFYLCNCQDERGISLPMYSDEWELAGPIIAENEIDIEHRGEEVLPSCWLARATTMLGFEALGNTAMEAAMRAYVLQKLGAEVEVPELE